jgi:Uma2 family endonuclease
MISCAPGTDDYFLDNPCFTAEVLSDSTATSDFTKKLDEYKKLPTLERLYQGINFQEGEPTQP